MEFFSWDEKYSTNIEKLDEDHKKLIGLFNEVYEKVFQCEDIEDESKLTKQTLHKLSEYIQYHFTSEEKFMIEIEYPEYIQHKQEHIHYNDEVNKLLIEYEQGGVALSFPTFMLLKDWISKHILVIDQKYSLYFMAKD